MSSLDGGIKICAAALLFITSSACGRVEEELQREVIFKGEACSLIDKTVRTELVMLGDVEWRLVVACTTGLSVDEKYEVEILRVSDRRFLKAEISPGTVRDYAPLIQLTYCIFNPIDDVTRIKKRLLDFDSIADSGFELELLPIDLCKPKAYPKPDIDNLPSPKG